MFASLNANSRTLSPKPKITDSVGNPGIARTTTVPLVRMNTTTATAIITTKMMTVSIAQSGTPLLTTTTRMLPR